MSESFLSKLSWYPSWPLLHRAVVWPARLNMRLPIMVGVLPFGSVTIAVTSPEELCPTETDLIRMLQSGAWTFIHRATMAND